MARLTPAQDALVIRLVYDGPPLSGKTTSLRALAGGMARSVFSPSEAAGRTLFFDWLEYVGGSFDGIPIHCQIVTVPGQGELAARRRALLAEADAVVLVLDTTPSQVPAALAHLGELREILAALPVPRPGVVVQANYRDRPEALPFAGLADTLGLDRVALVETVATQNHGIRDAFVLSVRLALDRARELLKRGLLHAGPGSTDDPAALLSMLVALDGDRPGARGAAQPLPSTPGNERRVPKLPDSGAPSGRVWPPIDGRIVLHASGGSDGTPRQAEDGSWRFARGDWHFHSAAEHEFADLDAGKGVLLRWAHLYTAGFERLSAQRCIALGDTGWGTWRLWQVLRVEESLRQRFQSLAKEAPPAVAAELVGARLLAALPTFALAPALPCRLDLVGDSQGRPVYIGLLPSVGWEPSAQESGLSDRDLVQREIQSLLASQTTAGDARTADVGHKPLLPRKESLPDPG